MVTTPRLKPSGTQNIDIPVLAKEDLNILREIVHAYKTKRLNMESIVKTPRMTAHSISSPDHYVAKLVEGTELPGISTDNPTGTGSQDRIVPGMGICNIYRILHTEDGPYLSKAFDREWPVYNIAKPPVGGLDYFDVIRDKFGRWIAVVGGEAGTLVRVTERFTVNSKGYYDWSEVHVRPDFPIKVGGRSGRYIDFSAAIEVNGGNRSIELNQNVVEIHFLGEPDTEDTTGSGSGSGPNGGALYWFDDSIPRRPTSYYDL